MILGFVEDKDVEPIIEMLPSDAHFILCEANIPRAMKVDELSDHFSKYNRTCLLSKKVHDAFEKALRLANPDDFIYIGGSTFIIADFMAWKKKHNIF